jgi:hypothetical protein
MNELLLSLLELVLLVALEPLLVVEPLEPLLLAPLVRAMSW